MGRRELAQVERRAGMLALQVVAADEMRLRRHPRQLDGAREPRAAVVQCQAGGERLGQRLGELHRRGQGVEQEPRGVMLFH